MAWWAEITQRNESWREREREREGEMGMESGPGGRLRSCELELKKGCGGMWS
jgi:hypothetical protein